MDYVSVNGNKSKEIFGGNVEDDELPWQIIAIMSKEKMDELQDQKRRCFYLN